MGKRQGPGKPGTSGRCARRKTAARQSLPRSLDEGWALDVVEPPEGVDAAGLYQLIVVATRAGIRHLGVQYRPIEEAEIVNALTGAMTQPVPPFGPARPRVVMVRSEALRATLADLASEAGFEVTVRPIDLTPLVADMAASGLELTLTTLLGVPRALEEALAHEAARLAASRPWERADDSMVLRIERRESPLRFPMAVVLGAAGVLRGLALYESSAAIARIRAEHGPFSIEVVPPSLILHLESAAEVGGGVGGFEVRGYPVTDGLYPGANQVLDGAAGPIEAEDHAAELLFAVGAVARYFDAWSGRAAPPVVVHLEHEAGSVSLESATPAEAIGTPFGLAHLFDWEHHIYRLELHKESLALEGLEVWDWPPSPDPVPCIVFKSTKADALRAAKKLSALDSIVVGQRELIADWPGGDFGVLADHVADLAADLGRLMRRDGTIVVALCSGGTKRSVGRLLAADFVWARRVELKGNALEAFESPFSADEFYRFEVSIDDITPRIWRRFLLRCDATFGDLHKAIQNAGGWYDYHLYNFLRLGTHDGERIATSPHAEPWDASDRTPDADRTPLATFFRDRRRRKCGYNYDFGDDWWLTVALEKVEKHSDLAGQRELLDGERAFPPEDCGGPWSYPSLIEALAAPDDDPELIEWLGDWCADAFDLDSARAEFRHSPRD